MRCQVTICTKEIKQSGYRERILEILGNKLKLQNFTHVRACYPFKGFFTKEWKINLS